MSMQRRLQFSGAILILLAVVLAAACAFAQASQPASQPATAALLAPVLAWLAANWVWLVCSALVPSIVTGLREQSVRVGVVGFLERLLERFSLATPSNSPGTFKLIGPLAKPAVKSPPQT